MVGEQQDPWKEGELEHFLTFMWLLKMTSFTPPLPTRWSRSTTGAPTSTWLSTGLRSSLPRIHPGRPLLRFQLSLFFNWEMKFSLKSSSSYCLFYFSRTDNDVHWRQIVHYKVSSSSIDEVEVVWYSMACLQFILTINDEVSLGLSLLAWPWNVNHGSVITAQLTSSIGN